MRWIKYQIVCNANENVLLTKKLEYSEANIAIAVAEAYNGYTIEDDSKSFVKEPLSIEFGGTGGGTAQEARENLGAAALDSNGKVVADQATSARGTNITANKTLTKDDNGKLFLVYQANVTITIPAGLPLGMEVEFCRWSDYTVKFAAASGVTIKSINNALSIANKNGCAVLKKATADEIWILAGDLI